MFVSECEISKQACVLRLCKKDKIKAATLAKHREEEVVVLCGVKQKLKKEIVSATMYKDGEVMTG